MAVRMLDWSGVGKARGESVEEPDPSCPWKKLPVDVIVYGILSHRCVDIDIERHSSDTDVLRALYGYFRHDARRRAYLLCDSVRIAGSRIDRAEWQGRGGDGVSLSESAVPIVRLAPVPHCRELFLESIAIVGGRNVSHAVAAVLRDMVRSNPRLRTVAWTHDIHQAAQPARLVRVRHELTVRCGHITRIEIRLFDVCRSRQPMEDVAWSAMRSGVCEMGLGAQRRAKAMVEKARPDYAPLDVVVPRGTTVVYPYDYIMFEEVMFWRRAGRKTLFV